MLGVVLRGYLGATGRVTSRHKSRTPLQSAALTAAAPLSTAPQATKMAAHKKVAVVTGANKGIGWDIARILADSGLTTVVTARSEELGRQATEKLQEKTGSPSVLFHQLDITDVGSVAAFAEWAKSELSSVNVLVNNAGLAFKGNVFGAAEAQQTLDVNLFGTRRVTEALLPLMSDGGSIVNVCSLAGKLSIIKDRELRARFEGAKDADEVAALARDFVAAIESDKLAGTGWPKSMYGVSKLCEATYTRLLAEELRPRGIAVNACCPGYCATDMSSWKGYKSSEQGADTPAWLALDPPATGKFWSERKEEPF